MNKVKHNFETRTCGYCRGPLHYAGAMGYSELFKCQDCEARPVRKVEVAL